MGKSAISMAIFNSFLYVYQRVVGPTQGLKHIQKPLISTGTDLRPGQALAPASWFCDIRPQPSRKLSLKNCTMWGPPVISWFINPSNYSYKML